MDELHNQMLYYTALITKPVNIDQFNVIEQKMDHATEKCLDYLKTSNYRSIEFIQRDVSTGDVALKLWEIEIPEKNNYHNWTRWFETNVPDNCLLIINGLEFLTMPYKNNRPIFKAMLIYANGIQVGPYILDNITNEGTYYFNPIMLNPKYPLEVRFLFHPLRAMSKKMLFPLVLKGKLIGSRSTLISVPIDYPDVIEESNRKDEGEEIIKPYVGFFCQSCQATYPPQAKRYQCDTCLRNICHTCIEGLKTVGMDYKCPNCPTGQLIEV